MQRALLDVGFQQVVHSGLTGKTGVTRLQIISEASSNERRKNARLKPLGRERLAKMMPSGRTPEAAI